MGKGKSSQQITDMACLCHRRLQEFAPGRCIEKQLTRQKGRPIRAPVSSGVLPFPPSMIYFVPNTSSLVFVISSTLATAEILDNASPRNPREDKCVRSSALRILLVEWRRNAFSTSCFAIPQPLSVIRIREIPPSSISTVTAVDPASIAFSTSSFTTEAGRQSLPRLLSYQL